MSSAEVEDLIAHLSGGLDPADRAAFRRAAENALATSPQCWGPGSVYRAIVPLWRSFFYPPTFEGRSTAWDQDASRASSSVSCRLRPSVTVAASAA